MFIMQVIQGFVLSLSYHLNVVHNIGTKGVFVQYQNHHRTSTDTHDMQNLACIDAVLLIQYSQHFSELS